MKPEYIPTINSDQKTPEYIRLSVDNLNDQDLSKVIVSLDANDRPLSRFTDDVWDFAAYVKTKKTALKRPTKWNWNRVPSQYRLAIKHLMYERLWEHQRTEAGTIKTISRTFGGLCRALRIMGDCGLPSLSALNVERNQQLVLDAIAAKKLRADTASEYLNSLNILKTAGYTKFDLSGRAKEIGKRLADQEKLNEQTLAIPQELANQIYGYAIQMVEQWHKKRTKLENFIDGFLTLNESNADSAKILEYLSKSNIVSASRHIKYKGNAGVNLTKVFYHNVMAACSIVIGAVSGMRIGEMYELSPESYTTRTFKGVTHCLLLGKTSKTNKGIPTQHAWVVAPVAKKAIELLACMTNGARRRLNQKVEELKQAGLSGDANNLSEVATSLYLALDAGSKYSDGHTVRSVTLDAAFQRLVAEAPDPETGEKGIRIQKEHVEEFKVINRDWIGDVPVGELWPLKSHQFRRTFAVFLVRNQFGSIVSIKQQYAHVRLAMSMWYGRRAELAIALDLDMDAEIQAEIAEMTALMLTDKAERLFLSDDPVSGRAALRVRQQRAEGNIVFESRDEIEAAMRSGELAIVDNGHSLCLNPKCGRVDCTIDPVINPVLCSHDVIFDEEAQARVRLRERLIKRHQRAVEQEIRQPNLLHKTLIGIRACEKVMSDHGIKFEPYGALIDIKETA
ncbi:hypothetical protein Fbal_1584 [Ferrimonas balearica DSM 9799]|uniref:Phage integrase family protein n=1 Tax=Ferrimonas balearica (strain DSM 9799 / CCM 4581 / KCTC 23876 / PAT) TaxID=550540 RepID=E1SPZ3_FERBD|nr:hypothetical protein [Ferrimonas balearica]ADN75788.1 hypothetical protein Fbal_1584 [Ferrimonas balearica DSM 9799]